MSRCGGTQGRTNFVESQKIERVACSEQLCFWDRANVALVLCMVIITPTQGGLPAPQEFGAAALAAFAGVTAAVAMSITMTCQFHSETMTCQTKANHKQTTTTNNKQTNNQYEANMQTNKQTTTRTIRIAVAFTTTMKNTQRGGSAQRGLTIRLQPYHAAIRGLSQNTLT